MAELNFKRKPFSSPIETIRFESGTSVMDLVERVPVSPALRKYLGVMIDGVEVAPGEWVTAVPSANSRVFVFVRPSGGDNGSKNIAAVVATIALSAFAVWAGPALAGAGAFGLSGLGLTGAAAGFVGGLITTGIMFVGSLLINALFPPNLSKQNLATAGQDSSSFFGIEGQRNLARPYQSIRQIFGTWKVAPDLAVEPIIFTLGDTQYLRVVYDFGIGNCAISDIRIGNTPIEYFRGVWYAARPHYTTGALSIYNGDHATESFAVEILDLPAMGNQFVSRATLTDDAQEITVDISFPMGLCWIDSDGNLKPKTASLAIYLQKDGGGWQAWGDVVAFYTTSHNILEVPQYSPPIFTVGALPSTQVSVKVSTGIPNRFGGIVTITIKVTPRPILGATAIQRTITRTFTVNMVSAQEVVQLLAGALSISETGIWPNRGVELIAAPMGMSVYVSDSYDATIDSIDISVAPLKGLTVNTNTASINRAIAEPFVFSVTMGGLQPGRWTVHIARVDRVEYTRNAGRPVNKHLDRTDLVAIRSTKYATPFNFRFEHTILELQVQATDQLNGIVDTITATATRFLHQWTGTGWLWGPTRNPAWAALEILRGPANPEPVPDSRIDLESFRQFAIYCDTSSNQGDVRFTCDANMDAESTVGQRILEILQSCRASLSLRDGKYAVIWEKFPTVPVQLFTPINSNGFRGERSFPRKVDGLKVQWVDPAQEYQQTEVIVYNDGKDKTNSHYFEIINATYCTRWHQAYREGRYHMAVGELRPEVFTLNTDIEHLVCERGDLVRVQHDVARMGGMPSRIEAISGLNITLREPVNSSFTKLLVRTSTGGQNEVNVVGFVDPYTVTVDRVPVGTAAGDLAVLGQHNLVTDDFLVKSISPGPELSATLTLVPVAWALQYVDIHPIPDYRPPISNDSHFYPSCLPWINVEASLEYVNRFPFANVIVHWPEDRLAIKYEVWLSDNGEDWMLHDMVNNVTNYNLWVRRSTLELGYPGTRQYVKVLPVNAFGRRPPLDKCITASFMPPKDTTPPGRPLFFAGQVEQHHIMFTWLPPLDPDIGGYVLKWTSNLNTPTWEQGSWERDIIPHDSLTVTVNVRTGSYMLRTIDTSGNLSAGFALVRTTIPELDGLDLVEIVQEDPGFTGLHFNTEVRTGILRLTSKSVTPPCQLYPYGVYTFAKIEDVGAIYDVHLSANIGVDGDACDPFVMADWIPNLATLKVMMPPATGDIDAVVQVRTASHLTVVMADWVPNLAAPIADPIAVQGNPSDWGGWTNLTAGIYSGRYFQFRIVMATQNPSVTPAISRARVRVDMPERRAAGHNLVVAAGGTRITFADGAFYKPPAVGVTQDNGQDGDTMVINNIGIDGFDAEIWRNGVSIAGQIDYVAVGYGLLQTTMLVSVEANEDDAPNLLPDAMRLARLPAYYN